MKLGDKMRTISTNNINIRLERANTLYNTKKDKFSQIIEDIIVQEAEQGHFVMQMTYLMVQIFVKAGRYNILIPNDSLIKRRLEECIKSYLVSENFFLDKSIIMWDNYEK